MAKTKTKRTASSVDAFSITLTLGNETYTASGATLAEALFRLEQPTKIFTKGVLKLEHGTQSREIPMQPMQVKRLFYPLAQKILAKQLAFGL